MTTEVKKLEETKGTFTLKGKIKGLNNERAVREGTTKKDKLYKAISFDIETEPNNEVRVELFGQERDVIFYNSKTKKSKRVPFENREKIALKGFRLMGINLNPSGAKNDRTVLCEYDAVDYIQENFKDGDSVSVRGQIDFSEFKNQHGEMIKKVAFRIQGITKLQEEIDYQAEDFEAHSFFKQFVVVDHVERDEEENRLEIFAKIIKYKGELADGHFVVDAERLKKFAKTLEKNLKFGDLIQLKGWVVSKTLLEKEEVDEDEDDVDEEDWGGETPEGMEESYIRNYINELQVVNVDKDTYEQEKYTEEDLFSEEEENYGEDIEDDEDENDEDEDDGDEELPFD